MAEKMTDEEAITRLKQMAIMFDEKYFLGLSKKEKENHTALVRGIEALQKEIPDEWKFTREDGRNAWEHDTENCLCSVYYKWAYCPDCGKRMK